MPGEEYPVDKVLDAPTGGAEDEREGDREELPITAIGSPPAGDARRQATGFSTHMLV